MAKQKSVRDMSNSELDDYTSKNNISGGGTPNLGVVPLPPPIGGYPAGYKLKSNEKPDIKGQKAPDPSIAEDNARIAQEVKDGTYLAGVPGESTGTTTTPVKQPSESKSSVAAAAENPPAVASPPPPAKSDTSVEKSKPQEGSSTAPIADASPKKSEPTPSDARSAARAAREANPEFNKSVDAAVDSFIQSSGVDPSTITAEERAAIRQEVVNQDQRVRDLSDAYKGTDPAKIAGAGSEVAAGNAKIDSLISNAGKTEGNDIQGATGKLPNPETTGSPDASSPKESASPAAETSTPPVEGEAAKPAATDPSVESAPASDTPPDSCSTASPNPETSETGRAAEPSPSGSDTASAPSGDTPRPSDAPKPDSRKIEEPPPALDPSPAKTPDAPKPSPPPVPSGLVLPGAVTNKELIGETTKITPPTDSPWVDRERRERFRASRPAPTPSAVPIVEREEDLSRLGGSGASLQIRFTHIPTNRTVKFTAFLDAFTDSFDAEWSSEKVFGRMDPIAQYKGTTRKINCGFTIPADSMEEAYYNHTRISTLLNMMYPTYTQDPGLNVYNIAAPPLMLVKFNNLIRSDSDHRYGLLGWIPSMKYEPNLDSPIFNFSGNDAFVRNFVKNFKDRGFNEDLPDDKTKEIMKSDSERVGWQSLKLSFELNVLHTHRLGYLVDVEGGYQRGSLQKSIAPSKQEVRILSKESERFPYGFRILKPGVI